MAVTEIDPAPLMAGLAWLICLAGIVLFAWALFWDRSRGRRRCPKCWYDMSGTGSLRCSECGYEAKRMQALHRTRRQWPVARAAVGIVVLAAILAAWGPVKRGVYARVLPTRLITSLYPHVPQHQQQFADELYRRLTDCKPISDEDSAAVFQLLVDESTATGAERVPSLELDPVVDCYAYYGKLWTESTRNIALSQMPVRIVASAAYEPSQSHIRLTLRPTARTFRQMWFTHRVDVHVRELNFSPRSVTRSRFVSCAIAEGIYIGSETMRLPCTSPPPDCLTLDLKIVERQVARGGEVKLVEHRTLRIPVEQPFEVAQR